VGALAVHATLTAHSIAAQLKWPNDVVVHGRKIAGILAEADAVRGALVLGIGLNVNLTPADLRTAELMQPATSMAIESGRTFDVTSVGARLRADLQEAYDVATAEGPSWLGRRWRGLDALAGRRIQIETAQGTISGTYEGLDAEARLQLRDDAGLLRSFWSGDVSVCKPPP
jgi:BirA family transcriptional regulator, biotin operon repressor / biotin---[acetyl-CoA-carboxylase] ligase